MSTTISKLLGLPLFEEHSKILAGKDSVLNEVQYITVMEVPDFNVDSLTDKVFILTTLSAHAETIEQINDIIKKLCEKKVSAIGIKLERFIKEVDPSTLAIADQYNIPLITFDKTVLFRELISCVLSEIVMEQRSAIDELNAFNKLLVSAILHNRQVEQILDMLLERVNCYCCCFLLNGEIIAERSSIDSIPDPVKLKCLAKKALSEFQGTYICDENMYVFPCTAHGRVMAFLGFCLEDNVTERNIMLAQQVVSFLAIKILENNLQLETEQRMTTTTLDEILFGQHKDEAVISDRLKLLGLMPKKNHVVLLFSYRENIDKNLSSIIHYSQMQKLKKMLQTKFDQVIVFLKGSDYIALISFNDIKKLSMDYIGETILKTLSEGVEQNIDFGCSLVVDSLYKIPECYDQSMRAINYGRKVDSENHVFDYESFIDIGLVSHSLGSSDSKVIYEKIIAPILEYDKNYNSYLWETLERCLIDGNLETSAKNLFIHVSTLRYRLQKINQITNINYFSAHGNFLLHLAYVLLKTNME